ncbi:hypothetical protein ACF1FX_08525 [Streptomyces sp. NPDC014646]|uniref:hypothetical protein n=1 Tax=unclassified Streptomyces TaxID=2593676 RepID=UPI0036C6CDFA
MSFLAEAFAAGPVMGIVFIRSMLVWLGLSLLSLRLFGQQLTWVLPLASAFPLVWFSDNAWWDWTAAPATDHVGWITAGLALIAGTAAMAVTPWRRRTLLGLGTPAVRGRARP